MKRARAYDVVIVGGGPAGLLSAGALARRGASVALFERTAYEAARVGETLGAEVGPLLRRMGAWDAVAELLGEQVAFRGVASAWGSDELHDRPSMFHPLGEGWHVDRRRLDARLADWAAAEGAELHRAAGRCRVAHAEDGFCITPARGPTARGRFFLDASGRGAPAGSALGGRQWVAYDRQIAIVGRQAQVAALAHSLVLEASAQGWWYTAPQPGGAAVTAFVTDADLLPEGGRARTREWLARCLAEAPHTRDLLGDALPIRLEVVRADSGRLVPDRGPGWRAVGDAAMATDPLGGNGVARALRSAEQVVEALDAPADARALAAVFDDYLALRARYYEAEERFVEARFWARRAVVDWRRVPLTLPPEAALAWQTEPSGRAESLLPPLALRAARAALSSPAPAHDVLAHMKRAAPLEDRRLLAGLELLVRDGAVVEVRSREDPSAAR